MPASPLRLSLFLLVGGCPSLALAQSQTNPRLHASKPKTVSPTAGVNSAPLKKYIGQVDAATNGFTSLVGELKSTSQLLQQAQSSSKDDDTIDPSSPEGKKIIKTIIDLQKAIVPFRNFNPVPHSAAKVDKEFVAFSLKMQEGLDMLLLYFYAQNNGELGDRAFKKLDEAFNILPVATAGIFVLEHTLDTQAVHKTYVPG